MGLVVVKLGGSLLQCEELRRQLRTLLAQRDADRLLLVVGGGSAADVVRDWSNLYGLSESMAHAVALRSLALTRSLMMHLLPEFQEVASLDDAACHWAHNRTPLLLDVERYLQRAELEDRNSLPHHWDVTSDSIAAWVASRWHADELILLKSTALDSGMDLALASRREFVDAYFPEVAVDLPRVNWCNLLEHPPRIRNWLRAGQLVEMSPSADEAPSP